MCTTSVTLKSRPLGIIILLWFFGLEPTPAIPRRPYTRTPWSSRLTLCTVRLCMYNANLEYNDIYISRLQRENPHHGLAALQTPRTPEESTKRNTIPAFLMITLALENDPNPLQLTTQSPERDTQNGTLVNRTRIHTYISGTYDVYGAITHLSGDWKS